MHVQIIYI